MKCYFLWEQVNYYYREDRDGAFTEREENNTISSIGACYNNMKQIILDVEAQIARGETQIGCMSAEEYRLDVISQMTTHLIYPPYSDLRRRSLRSRLIPILRPYVAFLAERPYRGRYRHVSLARNIMVFSFSLYMHLYVPLYYKYLDVKRMLGLGS